MKASERIKRGFWRIGLLGPAVAAVAVVFSLGVSGYNAMRSTVDIYAMGEYRTAPKNLTALEAVKLFDQWFSGLSPEDKAKHSGRDEFKIIWRQIKSEAERDIWEPFTWILASAIGGLVWFGFWLLLSWLVRGFLA